jgi:hypothetical protein
MIFIEIFLLLVRITTTNKEVRPVGLTENE